MSRSLSLRLIPGPDGIPVLQTTSNGGLLGTVTGWWLRFPWHTKNSHSITDDEYYNGVSALSSVYLDVYPNTDQQHLGSDLSVEHHLYLRRMVSSSQFCSPFQIRYKFQQHIKSNAVANGWAWTGVPFTNICRHALPTGTIVGVSLAVVAAAVALIPLLLWRRRRRTRLDSYTASLVVSPFVPLTSGTDTSDAPLRYRERELRTAGAQLAEAGAVTEKQRSPVENGTPQASAGDSGSSSHSPVTSETHAQMAALQARIRDLEGQRYSAWALGFSADAPPEYAA
ncbi:hypothetical protein B0H13DRAFT_1895917 [Mycena leptocephala]|nr:hypothetical protein B0H13DRAFT_1895917 [Mycena leptocephala]